MQNDIAKFNIGDVVYVIRDSENKPHIGSIVRADFSKHDRYLVDFGPTEKPIWVPGYFLEPYCGQDKVLKDNNSVQSDSSHKSDSSDNHITQPKSEGLSLGDDVTENASKV